MSTCVDQRWPSLQTSRTAVVEVFLTIILQVSVASTEFIQRNLVMHAVDRVYTTPGQKSAAVTGYSPGS